jgi:hypothetical protein
MTGYEERVAWAMACALIRRKCPWCDRELRPCNMARHVDAAHFHQLTVDEVIADAEARR